MEKKPKNNKNLWLYGAFASLVVAIIGLVLVLFVFNDEKKHKADDDEDDDDIELVDEERNDWYDKDEWGKQQEAEEQEEAEEQKSLKEDSVKTDRRDILICGPDNPTFPEGDPRVWIANHIHYPPEAEDSGIQGTVVCQFIVEKDGSLSDLTIFRGIHPSLDEEAIRVLGSMPNWNPGTLNGDPVRVKYTIPIKFQLQ